ncbi:hypothetical protein [Spirulina subsalsa]|nr:hypothetical protein [Spirulina subsalsa]
MLNKIASLTLGLAATSLCYFAPYTPSAQAATLIGDWQYTRSVEC